MNYKQKKKKDRLAPITMCSSGLAFASEVFQTLRSYVTKNIDSTFSRLEEVIPYETLEQITQRDEIRNLILNHGSDYACVPAIAGGIELTLKTASNILKKVEKKYELNEEENKIYEFFKKTYSTTKKAIEKVKEKTNGIIDKTALVASGVASFYSMFEFVDLKIGEHGDLLGTIAYATTYDPGDIAAFWLGALTYVGIRKCIDQYANKLSKSKEDNNYEIQTKHYCG